MHYSLFIPQVTGANPRHLDAVGLGDLLRPGDVGPQMADIVDHGPDGGPGLLFTWPGSIPAYQPQGMNWYAAKPDPERGLPAGRFHWGFQNDAPPTPHDLLRTNPFRGRVIDLGSDTRQPTTDNSPWLMPNITLLPHNFILDDTGHEAREVSPDYQAIYDRGMWAYELLRSQIIGEAIAPAAEMRRYAVEMLNLNYRIFRDLAYHLHLLTEANWFTLACASIDIEALIQIEQDTAKKKQQAIAAALTPPT